MTETSQRTELGKCPRTDIGLDDPEVNPARIYDELKCLRETAPVATWDRDEALLVSSYGLVREAFESPQRFRSTGILESDLGRFPPLDVDPPEHKDFRALLANRLGAHKIKAYETTLRQFVDGVLDGVPAGETVDLISLVAEPIPVHVITSIVGLPETDTAELRRLSQMLFADFGPGPFDALVQFFLESAKSRRENPTDDLVSVFADAQINGETISEADYIGAMIGLLAAGHHSTIAGIGLALNRLAANPTLLDRIHADPTLADGVLDETLRLEPPFQSFTRIGNAGATIAGVAVEDGEKVELMIASANRDPDEFIDPDTFDPERDNLRRSMTFGHGIHRCVGMHLARAELRTVLLSVADRYSHIERAGEVKRMGPGTPHLSFPAALETLPVRLVARV